MPMYDYECEEHGEFESFEKVSNRKFAKCPECDEKCHKKEMEHVNQFLAKTRYIPPPLAKRAFGDNKAMPHMRKKWV